MESAWKKVSYTAAMVSFLLASASGEAFAADRDDGGVVARSCDEFLSSLGVNTHVSQGYNPAHYVEPLKYLGVRNIRDSGRQVGGLLALHAQAGIRVDLIADDLTHMLQVARSLAKADALLAIEGPNEPNNFSITYNGQKGGGPSGSWIPVAELQRDIYRAVHGDPDLNRYPVYGVSEAGAEAENVGLQYLTIPPGAGALFPDGTQFADYANPHNYVSAVSGGYSDNQAWQAASPTLNGRWDGLYGEYGRTWRKHFKGYSSEQLETLPRVTSETGWDAAKPEEEKTQGVILVNNYLAQFSQGWRYTFIYELGEGEGGGGHQGLFHTDWTPKLSGTYIHNLTSILMDGPLDMPAKKLNYSIANKAATTHDLLLQKRDGTFELMIWGELVSGTKDFWVEFGSAHVNVNVYDITVGTTPVQTFTDVAGVPLALSDHAMVIEAREVGGENR